MTWLSVAGYQIAPHVSQKSGTTRLRIMGCVPSSGANGLNTVTGRRLDGDDVLVKVPQRDESNPQTLGWSLADLDLAMARLGVGFENRSGRGRAGVRAAWAANQCVAIQGRSTYFANTTCSGEVNVPHCIVVYPARKVINGVYHRWIADPWCLTGRWERESEIWQYAEGLASSIWFGVFLKPVTKTPIPKPPDTGAATHRAYFDRGAMVKVYRLDSRGRIVKQPNGRYYTYKPWNNPDSSAPCTTPIRRVTADGQSAALTVTVTKGYYYRDTIAVNSDGVDVKEE